MAKSIAEFEWLSDLIANIPEDPKQRQNLFEIAGFPHREQVVSNMLAFYFDKTQEHCFGNLFLSSLLKLASQKLGDKINIDQFNEDYEVHREYDYIDLLLVSQEKNKETPLWTIIIENKVYAELYNDLQGYWYRTKAVNKLGIVLSIKEESLAQVKDPSVFYICITHQELMAEVKQNLHTVLDSSDDRHLLFFKDFCDNINKHYEQDNANQPMEAKLIQFQKYKEQIASLMELEVNVKRYLMQSFMNIFEKHGFEPSTSSTHAYSKHFLLREGSEFHRKYPHFRDFRFFVDTKHFIRYGKVLMYFELHGAATQYGKDLKDFIKKQELTEKHSLQDGYGGGSTGDYYHMAKWEANLDLDEEHGFATSLDNLITEKFFTGKPSFVEAIATWYEQE